MNLTVKQASEKLGVSRLVVQSLIKKGVLTDLKPRTEGAKKHFSIVGSKEVRSLRPVLKKVVGSGKLTDRMVANVKAAIAGGEVAVAALAPAKTSRPAPKAAGPAGFAQRLSAVEAEVKACRGILERLAVAWGV